jgi:hypothetical protein
MPKLEQQSPKFRLHTYGLLCAFLIGCSTPSGNYNLGKADAQLGGLIADYPGIAKELEQIRANVRDAEIALKEKEVVIATLSKSVAKEEERAQSRLVTIWKLTSVLVGILRVVGVFIAWKIK